MSLKRLAQYLQSQREHIPSLRSVTGFDGFVDEMITVVEERQSLDQFTRVEDINRFGDLVKKAAGHSSLREIVVTAMHPGGCAVNMGDGLATLGIHVDTFATLGEPIHPAFHSYGEIATLHSWGNEPGRTLAFEFADGKLMYSAVRQLADFDRECVAAHLERGVFKAACAKADLIAFTDWTLYPHMTAVWKLLSERVFNEMEEATWLFIDLVDPSSRSDADIRAMLGVLKRFAPAMQVVLGLNQNEANILSRILDGQMAVVDSEKAMIDQASRLREALGIEQVVIHAHATAVCAGDSGTAIVEGPYCAHPKKSTGAGDRFNAGYALGLMLGLCPEDCLLTAVSSSGFFVRNARSASIDELVTFIGDWASGNLDTK